jgi:hypothetical protein
MRIAVFCVVAITVGCGLVACGPSVEGDDDDDGIDAPAIDARIVDADTTIDGEEVDFSRVYAHSGQMLYRLDTATLTPVLVGPFGLSSGSITDIAVDKDDRMLGVGLSNIYTIDIDTGAATLLTPVTGISDLTSLSFVPLDLANPDSAERLVAATAQGDVVEINQTTGATTVLGNYGVTAAGGEQIRSSGDIVAITGFGIYATVTVGSPLSNPDYLAQINPTTWAATLIGGGTPYDKIFGVGFWRNKLYGFVDTGAGTGAIIEIAINTGVATPVNTGNIQWFGAGVTTDAPIID